MHLVFYKQSVYSIDITNQDLNLVQSTVKLPSNENTRIAAVSSLGGNALKRAF